MNKNTTIAVACVASIVGMFVFLGFTGVYYSNMEIENRNQITAKINDNKNQFDLMWKQISQTAQVTQESRASLNKILVEYASARSTGDKQIMTWIKESVPNVSDATFINLQNIISSARSSFAMRQTELLDLNRKHENLLQKWPSSMFVGSRQSIEIQIITSDKTESTFNTGKDNDTDIFKK